MKRQRVEQRRHVARRSLRGAGLRVTASAFPIMPQASVFTADGGCDCGAVRFRMTARPLFVHCCHCRWCQRETGSAFALNALIETDRIELPAGAPEPVITPSPSGKGQKIMRCPSCRIAVWSHYAGAGDKVAFVRVGALDHPDRLPPDIHIYTTSKQSWVHLGDGAPVVAEYYDWKEYWPAESIERRRAMSKPATS